MELEEAIKIAKSYVPIAKSIYPESAIYLFGSQAKGYATEKSDIDIAVIIAAQTKDFIQRAREKTDLDTEAFYLDRRIEIAVVSLNDQSGFLGNILSTGIRVDESTDSVLDAF